MCLTYGIILLYIIYYILYYYIIYYILLYIIILLYLILYSSIPTPLPSSPIYPHPLIPSSLLLIFCSLPFLIYLLFFPLSSSSDLYSPLPPSYTLPSSSPFHPSFPPLFRSIFLSSLFILLPIFQSFPFPEYLSALGYAYLYSPISLPNPKVLTPHVLSEWMVEVCAGD